MTSLIKTKLSIVIFLTFSFSISVAEIPNIPKGNLLYDNPLATAQHVEDWVMEGPGKVIFKEGWMHMYSPDEKMHHVFWSPFKHPQSFIAQWEAQNIETDAGLVISIFSAIGQNAKSIFDESLNDRDGTFSQYINGDIKTYHTSYYANAAHNPDRKQTNLRKNPGFVLVQEGSEGVPTKSTKIHLITIAKIDDRITVYVDNKKVIDWQDKGENGNVLGAGFIGFRQMQWTHFRYRNFKIWSVKK